MHFSCRVDAEKKMLVVDCTSQRAVCFPGGRTRFRSVYVESEIISG